MPGKKENPLTNDEKSIIKALLNEGMPNQDILNLINTGRISPINSGRISEIKKLPIDPAPNEVVQCFVYKKNHFDLQTGLNDIDDERIVKAREAMFLAVNIFNTPHIKFKAEAFSVYANIAWTYLIHEFCKRKNIDFEKSNGQTLALSQLINKPELHLSKGIIENLKALKDIRDAVEHRVTGTSDRNWYSIFQACCLNFETVLTNWFGPKVSIQKNLSLALQFAKLSINQIENIQEFNIPGDIIALDKRLNQNLSEDQENDIEYRLQVIYTLNAASKEKSHIRFVSPDSQEGKAIHNVLVRDRMADDLYPYKPSSVCILILKHFSNKICFSWNAHAKACEKYEVRPSTKDVKSKLKRPEETNKDYCIYHKSHRDYTYNQAWVDFLIKEIQTNKLEVKK